MGLRLYLLFRQDLGARKLGGMTGGGREWLGGSENRLGVAEGDAELGIRNA